MSSLTNSETIERKTLATSGTFSSVNLHIKPSIASKLGFYEEDNLLIPNSDCSNFFCGELERVLEYYEQLFAPLGIKNQTYNAVSGKPIEIAILGNKEFRETAGNVPGWVGVCVRSVDGVANAITYRESYIRKSSEKSRFQQTSSLTYIPFSEELTHEIWHQLETNSIELRTGIEQKNFRSYMYKINFLREGIATLAGLGFPEIGAILNKYAYKVKELHKPFFWNPLTKPSFFTYDSSPPDYNAHYLFAALYAWKFLEKIDPEREISIPRYLTILENFVKSYRSFPAVVRDITELEWFSREQIHMEDLLFEVTDVPLLPNYPPLRDLNELVV